jgi:hypothetical protein
VTSNVIDVQVEVGALEKEEGSLSTSRTLLKIGYAIGSRDMTAERLDPFDFELVEVLLPR